MSLLISRIITILDLGIPEFLSVLLYRVLLRSSIHPVCFIKSEIPVAPFFCASKLASSGLPSVITWKTSVNLFSYINIDLADEPPLWLANPITGGSPASSQESWWKISDFDDSTGDIKLIWEQSRFNWVVAFAQRIRNGDEGSLNRLNWWLSDWIKHNPPYLGRNWKCGQEASIRVIHLCCAALILGQARQTLVGLQELIRLHLRRIEPTLHYAIAQNNNHGTSEAAALFIGGSWLGGSDGKKYESLGRRWLEDRATKLIEKDGSFSQYSLNYHRMALDSFSIAEVWRAKLQRKRFTPALYAKVARAASWLHQMICPVTGDGPNLGANDGALLLQLTDSAYRDYRPSVQLSSALFGAGMPYPEAPLCDLHLGWLGIISKEFKKQEYVNCDYDCGGYKILRSGVADLFFRYPRFRFRPSQSDALHIDLRINGVSFLRDAGSFSYNSTPDEYRYFSGTASHNTVQFDDRDQMPRLGRFLFGSWLQTKNHTPLEVCNDHVKGGASYIDYKGAGHKRTLHLDKHRLVVTDEIVGFRNKAVLRWRLPEGVWEFHILPNGVKVTQLGTTIIVTSDIGLVRACFSLGWESLHYAEKKEIQVLECEVNLYGTLQTEIRSQ